ncbi:STAS domain-containing protein [Streptomyces sp. NPDC005963]|uniref:STAS domain-containing protein n=1 Tax=Streptomyces sp. NPDC005963 TaxID=3156721 RepID=UPI0033EDCFC0
MVSGVSGHPREGEAATRRFGIEVRPAAGALVVVLAGELDHDTAPPLRDALAEGVTAGRGRIVVDCAELGFCDSTGLNVLLRARIEAQESGSVLELSALQPQVARMFDITGADTVFTVHDSLDAALADRRQS